MDIKLIRTEEDYQAACERVYELMHASTEQIPKDSPEGDEIELLSILIERYEQDYYSLGPPDPIEAIKFQMDQMDLKQKDIAPLFGGKTRISEVLNRKRPLSMRMMILLNRYLGIPMETLTLGNKDVYLNEEELKTVMEHPSIGTYLRQSKGRQV